MLAHRPLLSVTPSQTLPSGEGSAAEAAGRLAGAIDLRPPRVLVLGAFVKLSIVWSL